MHNPMWFYKTNKWRLRVTWIDQPSQLWCHCSDEDTPWPSNPSVCHGTSQLRRLINPHKLCSAAWHGQQSFLPLPLRDPHDDPPLQTRHRLVVRQRDLVSPRQRHVADVFLWGIAFQYPYWYASAFQPLHQACSVWGLVAHNDDIAPLQAVLSWKHAMVMTSEHRMVTSPSPEMGVSEHRPMTWCLLSEHRTMTWCLQNMPGSWPVSMEWGHHPVQRLMSVNTDQWHDVLKTCQDHDQWARNGDITLSRDWCQWTQTNDMMSSKHARIMTSEHGIVTSHQGQWTQTNDMMSSKHARIMTCEHKTVTSARSVNTDQRHHTILKTCLDHDQWTQTNHITLSWKHALSMISEHRPTASHYPENMPWSWSVNTDQWHKPSWKHALTMISEHRMQTPPSPENMPWSWSANTYPWCRAVRKTYHDHDQ